MIIYIPIWLDLLSVLTISIQRGFIDLHSNMVRFIILIKLLAHLANSLFTFQYG